MSSAWSQLEQMLTCAICLDKFKNPRLLPCQHSFCGDACMDGLVDYARRQIKCPECRAEHRIPYQGVQSLPLNVTLIRFLELHARITGEEPEPVPTFMEKCTICGEKIEGVQRCAHCDKKVCPECKEAHLDLLRREIGRINGQTRRSLNKLHEFKETLAKAEEKLNQNELSVRAEIEDSCKRLISDLQAKQRRLLEEVDTYVELERKTIDKLKVALVDECKIIESNLELADEKLTNGKYQWNDFELTETKEIYNKTMEFVRLFDPEIGDYNRKVRFILVPEFEALRKRLCELGELKFSESAQSLIANSFQYCNATGQLAQELCQAAAVAAQQQQQQQLQHHQGAYGLAHSNSNTNLGLGQQFGNQLGLSGQTNSVLSGGGATSQMLELPNSLMRSQSDHRLASQFQARLKQQQEASKNGGGGGAASRYGLTGAAGGAGGRLDYESESSIRSRYGPGRASGPATKDYGSDLLRDWPRPSDNDSEMSFGSSIQFKSAFMRRKEKERQQQYLPSYYNNNDDDDDLTSEASYGGGRNVRFNDQDLQQQQQLIKANAPKVFDCREVEHAPLSGVPKLDECPQLQTRLHQLGAKAVVDKKHAEEEGKRDKDLVESARRAMSRASERLQGRQASEDEIEKQKKANKQQELAARDEPANGQQQVAATTETANSQQAADLAATPTGSSSRLNLSGAAMNRGEPEQNSGQNAAPGSASSGSPATPTSSSTMPGGRRSLYGQAVTEKSRRQLSNAIQDAASYSARRRSLASSRDDTEAGGDSSGPSATPGGSSSGMGQVSEQAETEQTSSAASGSHSGGPRRRFARSQSSRGSQQSIDGVAPGTPTARRRKLLSRADSSLQRQQSSIDSATGSVQTGGQPQAGGSSKNSPVGSGGDAQEGAKSRRRRTESTTTDEDDDEDDDDDQDDDEEQLARNTGTIRRAKLSQRSGSSTSSRSQRLGSAKHTSSRSATKANEDEEDNENDEDGEREDEDDERAAVSSGSRTRELDETGESSGSRRNSGNRRSREFLPSYVNKLLDRSAQIRRDSQEQRSRGDSPQRSGTSESTRHSSPIYSRPSASGYSSSPGSGTGSTGVGRRHHQQRLTYQRSSQQNDDETPNNSSQSIYTTASSQRRSSEEDQPGTPRRTSTGGSSTDRTVVGASEYTRHRADLAGSGSRYSSTASSASRRDSGDAAGSGIFQSRFLSRSRTSAALASGDSEQTSSLDYGGSGSGGTSGTRSYLSSRDRFLASAGSVTGSLATTASPTTTTTATSGSSAAARASKSAAPSHSFGYYAGPATKHPLITRNLYWPLREAPKVAVARDGKESRAKPSRTIPLSQAAAKSLDLSQGLNLQANKYKSAYLNGRIAAQNGALPGFRTHSEYLRNKFARRGSSNSSGSSSSLRLSRSKSSHTFASGGSQGEWSRSGCGLNPDDSDEGEASSMETPIERRAGGSGGGDDDAELACSPNWSPIYSPKGRMLFKLGSRGSEPGNFTWPRGVAVGQLSSGRGGHEIVVADSSNHRVQVFSSRGKFISEFGSYGSAQGEFDCLAGVAVSSNRSQLHRNYIVSDRYNHRVQIFDMSGRFVRSFGEFGRDQAQFNLPWGVACDSAGLIYVCDKENHRVQVFDSQGLFVSRFGQVGSQPGQMQHPHYIALDASGRVVVTDTNNHRVQLFDTSGRLIKVLGREGSQPGEFKFPRGVAADSNGFIVVGDSGNNRLQVFNADGHFVKAIGTWGSAEGEFKGIEGVAVDSTNGNIYVCDRENHRIQVF